MTITWLADVLRNAGLEVVEHTGWKTYYKTGTWDPTFGIAHATAAPKSQSDDVQVSIVRNGREGLTGPIANACVDRRGRWHVISAGKCNTTIAGTAGPYNGKGNTNALGIEACNDNVNEPWPEVQYAAYVVGWGAICKKLGWDASHVRGHKEHTPGHKTDPTLNMANFRSDIAAAIRGDYVAFSDEQKQDIENACRQAIADVIIGAGKAGKDGNAPDVTGTDRQVRDGLYWSARGTRDAILAKSGQLEVLLNGILTNVTSDDNDTEQIIADAQQKFADLKADIANVDDEVIGQIGNPTVDVQVAADLIRELAGTPQRLAALKAAL